MGGQEEEAEEEAEEEELYLRLETRERVRRRQVGLVLERGSSGCASCSPTHFSLTQSADFHILLYICSQFTVYMFTIYCIYVHNLLYIRIWVHHLYTKYCLLESIYTLALDFKIQW